MRTIFGEKIVEFVDADPMTLVVVGDFGWGVLDKFRRMFPTRFYNVGTMEQSMVGVAAGLAIQGWHPWVYTITPFLIERAFEQIKLDVDAQNVCVRLVGYADYADQGVTHQELDPSILMGLLSNTASYFPKTRRETEEALDAMRDCQGPAFISLKKLGADD